MEGNSIINTTPSGKVDAQKWLRFSEVLTLSLGAGLLLSGIIFFFAYNWETIHRFIKMGIVAALLLSTFVAVVKVPMRDWVRNITIFFHVHTGRCFLGFVRTNIPNGSRQLHALPLLGYLHCGLGGCGRLLSAVGFLYRLDDACLRIDSVCQIGIHRLCGYHLSFHPLF